MQLPTFARDLAGLCRARLSLRIVLWIFLSLALIEGALLVPSVAGRRQELLAQIAEVSTGKIDWILTTYPTASGQQLADELQLLMADPMLRPVILGGAVYRGDGTLVATFGEAPALAFADARQSGASYEQTAQGRRYDVAWRAAALPEPHVIVLRHNASRVETDVLLYVLSVVLMVALTSAFVTLVVMLSLGSFLISPILTLRRDLARAGEAIAGGELAAQFDSGRERRNDELGDVIDTFHRMFSQITQAVRARRAVEQELRQTNLQMQKYLQQVDQVTAAAAAVERGSFTLDELPAIAQRPDELGSLARVFLQMADEVQRREAALKQQLVELKIEIDQQKRARDVAQITGSSLFQELRAEVSGIDLDAFWHDPAPAKQ